MIDLEQREQSGHDERLEQHEVDYLLGYSTEPGKPPEPKTVKLRWRSTFTGEWHETVPLPRSFAEAAMRGPLAKVRRMQIVEVTAESREEQAQALLR